MVIRKYKYLTARRLTQTGLLLLFIAGNAYGWQVLRGNLSSAKVLNAIPLSDPFAVMQSLAAGVTVAADALIGAIIIFLAYAIIGGRVFCSWVCPVNMVTDMADRLRTFFNLDDDAGPWRMKRGTRYWMTGLSLILSAMLSVSAFEWISPIGLLHRGIIYGMGLGWTFVLVVFLFDIFAVKNGFCGHLCPLGAFYALIGRFGFLKIAYSKENCTMCKKCLDICPEKQVLNLVGKQSGAVLSGECTNCGRCIEVCDEDAVRFSNVYKNKFGV